MQIIVYTGIARSMGSNTTYSLAGQFLQDGLSNYGTAIAAVEITAYFRGGDVGHSSLQPRYDHFHSTVLPSLPKTKFLRKKAQVQLAYETAVVDAAFLERYGVPLSAEAFAAVLREMADRLHLIDAKSKRSDAFDLPGFHGVVAARVAAAPATDGELRQVQAKLEADRKARLAAMGPWEKLGIDWDEYHPDARRLLDDPFLWDPVDGFAPHGNDTGADVLGDFRPWNRRHPDRPAHERVGRLLRDLGFEPIDLVGMDDSSARSLVDRDPDLAAVVDDALIAAAFAAVKLRGGCDGETRRLALDAIGRRRTAAVAVAHQWPHRAERIATLEYLRTVLSRMPEPVA